MNGRRLLMCSLLLSLSQICCGALQRRSLNQDFIWFEDADSGSSSGSGDEPSNLGVVTDVTIQVTGVSSARVTWVDDGQDVQDGYVVCWQNASNGVSSNNATTNNTSYSITGLEPGAEYNVSVAECTDCNSTTSVVGNFTEADTTAKTKLVAPGNLAVSEVTSDTITVTWENEPRNEAEYSIVCEKVNSDDVGEKNSSTTVGTDVDTAECSNLTPGTLYNISIETVKSGFVMEECEDCSVEDITIPEAVQSLVVTALNTTSAKVTWNFDGQGNYEYFNLSYWTTTEILYASTGTLEVSNLEANQLYTFSMVTWSDYGNGRVAQSEAVEKPLTTPPDPVDSLTVNALGPNTLLVSWVRSQENVTHFVFTVNDTDTGECKKLMIFNVSSTNAFTRTDLPVCSDVEASVCDDGGLENACRVPDLEACTNYTIDLFVYNAAHRSEASTERNSTGIADVSEPITGLVQISSTAESVLVRWDPATEPDKCAVKLYRVTYEYQECDSGVTKNGPVEDVSKTERNISNLPQANWTYTIIVEAFTQENGNGSQSRSSTIADTSESTPGIPTEFSATPTTVSNITLVWKKPAFCDRNGIITGYSLTYNCTEVGESVTVEDDVLSYAPEDEEGTITLNPYLTCSFYLRANTSAGWGDAEVATAQTDQSTPGLVNATSIDAMTNASSIKLTWDEPEYPNRNGIITKYTVMWKEVGLVNQQTTEGEKNVSTPVFLLTNLAAYTVYNFSIAAWTDVGMGDFVVKQSETTESKPGKVVNVTAQPLDPNSINVTWQTGTRTGPTNYTIRACKVPRCEAAECETVQRTGFDTISAVVTGLIPKWMYSVDVFAETVAGEGERSDPVDVETLPSSPPPVDTFVAETILEDCATFRGRWSALLCETKNDVIVEYIITATSQNDSSIVMESQVPSGLNEYSEILSATAENVFEVKIMARGETEDGAEFVFPDLLRIGSCAPPFPNGETDNETNVGPSPSQEGLNTKRQYRIDLLYDFLTNSVQGEIKQKGYIVVGSDFGGVEEGQEDLDVDDFDDEYSMTWHDVQEETPVPPYRATPAGWEPQAPAVSMKRDVNPAQLSSEIIGEKGDCKDSDGTFCNGYLNSDTSYRVKAFACTSSRCSVTTYSEPFATEKSSSDATAIAVGVVVPLIVIALIVAVIGFIFYRRRSVSRYGKPTKPAENGLTVVVAQNNVNEAFVMDEPPKPVPKDEFYAHVQTLRKDSDLLFSEEYKLLRDMSPRMDWEIAELPANRVKNRYTNILAYDHSRVKLLPTEDEEEGSDYINANYMPGFNSKREFIAAQGPLPSTKDDFWRMVWEQNVPIIVMLTKCYERGRLKCDQYWPNDTEPVFYGDLQVHIKSESVLDHYTIRIFDIKLGEKTHSVKQFHFTTWPDMGSPDTTEALLGFVKDVRSHVRPDMVGPQLTHCSAGVGRTGTYICVDTLLHHIVDHDTIDIFGLVLELRKYRTNIVQTEDQYIYIHECMKDALKRGITLRPAQYEYDEPPEYDSLGTEEMELEENLYENVEIGRPVETTRDKSDAEDADEGAPLNEYEEEDQL